VSAPLIPYIQLPELPLDFLLKIPVIGGLFGPTAPTIKPFGTLVALGVYIGSVVALRHSRDRGIDQRKINSFIFWVVGLGFVGGHVFDALFYHPVRVRDDPAYLFKLWDGLSSYGGFMGAAIGTFAWRYRHREAVMPMVECLTSAFPLAWVFGRSGCSVVHDHPGKRSDAWFAVQFPGGGKFDLGLIEMVLTIPLALAFLWLWQRQPKRPVGFYTGWMCALYAPVRLALDFLREEEQFGGDERYAGLTPAQWGSFALFATGVWFLSVSRNAAKQAAFDEATRSLSQPWPELGQASALAEPVDGQQVVIDEGAPPKPKKGKRATGAPKS
jgi:phosphatidylglycerol:prolipoprotein diacylglycerol transferase